MPCPGPSPPACGLSFRGTPPQTCKPARVAMSRDADWVLLWVVVLGWSTRLALGKNPAHPETSRGLASALRWATRIGWTASFVLVPGPPQLIYSFIRPAPARFRLLSVIVSFSFVVGTGISIVVFALARSAGLTP